jgi:hypothetical protein
MGHAIWRGEHGGAPRARGVQARCCDTPLPAAARRWLCRRATGARRDTDAHRESRQRAHFPKTRRSTAERTAGRFPRAEQALPTSTASYAAYHRRRAPSGVPAREARARLVLGHNSRTLFTSLRERSGCAVALAISAWLAPTLGGLCTTTRLFPLRKDGARKTSSFYRLPPRLECGGAAAGSQGTSSGAEGE